MKRSQFKKLSKDKQQQVVINDLKDTDLDYNGIRSRLHSLINYGRQNYTGEYVRCGYKTDGGYGYNYLDDLDFFPTLLIKNVRCNGIPVTSHLWLNYTDSFISLGQLKPGDIVSFSAKVGSYRKGYYLHRVTDYQLHSLRNIELIKANHKMLPLPNDPDLVVGYSMVKNAHFYLQMDRPYSPSLVASFDKWSQKYTPNHLQEVATAEKLADNYNPMPYYDGSDDSNVTDMNETEANDEKHSKLVKLGNKKRYTFVGRYVGINFTSFKKHYTPNLTINDIYYHNQKVCDGLTFNYSKSFKKLGELHPGDRVQFNARVKVNVKNKGLVSETHYYKLAYPTHAKLIKKTDNKERVPFPLDKKNQDIIVGYAMERTLDLDYVPFRVHLWKMWKLKYRLSKVPKRYKQVKTLLLKLYNQKSDDTYNNHHFSYASNNSVLNLSDISSFLYSHSLLCQRLGIISRNQKVYDLTSYRQMDWYDLVDRCKVLLKNHHAQFKIKNPLKNKKRHFIFLHNTSLKSLVDNIITPIILHDFATYFYLIITKDKVNDNIYKYARKFNSDDKVIEDSNKIINSSWYTTKANNNRKKRLIRLCFKYYIKLIRDAKSKYSGIKLSQQSLRNIKKIVYPKYLNLHLNSSQELRDIREASNYVDYPILRGED